MPAAFTPAAFTAWLDQLRDGVRGLPAPHLDALADLFGDPRDLAPVYIPPDCQRVNPADVDEDDPRAAHRSPLFQHLAAFLSPRYKTRDGRSQQLVLADAGMGKTSLLVMLRLTHLLGAWPAGLDCHLLKLGPDSLDRIGGLIGQRHTVLLLDSLDEDPLAWGRVEERLSELLHATQNFRQVVLTCRTQFFPRGGPRPIERPDTVEVGGFVCPMVYLSPFSDPQVDDYLTRIYPNRLLDELRRWFTRVDNQALEQARELVRPMRSLRMRPLLLSYIEDLRQHGVDDWSEFGLYDTLVDAWLRREERKHSARRAHDPALPEVTRAALLAASEAVARRMHQQGRRTLTLDEIGGLLATDQGLGRLDVLDLGGRSLLNRTSEGDFRFSHYSIQEFLVVRQLVRGALGDTRLRASGQMLRFLMDWRRLNQDAASLGWLEHLDAEGADLREEDLCGIDLSGWSLKGANLAGADLRNANLSGADLEGAMLAGCDASGVRLNDAVLRGASLWSARLFSAHLLGADLRGADLRNTDLRSALLRGADLRGADLSGAVMGEQGLPSTRAVVDGQRRAERAWLKDALWDAGTRWPEGTVVRDALFIGLNTELSRVELEDVDLSGADLRGARISGTLRKVSLRGADLRGAWIGGGVLDTVDLSEAQLDGARIGNVKLTDCLFGGGPLPGLRFEGVTFKRCLLRDGILEGCRFEEGSGFTACWFIRVGFLDCPSPARFEGCHVLDTVLDVASVTRPDAHKKDRVWFRHPPPGAKVVGLSGDPADARREVELALAAARRAHRLLQPPRPSKRGPSDGGAGGDSGGSGSGGA
ncbi:MAG: pentapeptide repeat-containing protein [Alphaproteobacteria bacterium]|nr:pentapeptide repeat-containing protein [Alphaproteobacteria bacterium]